MALYARMKAEYPNLHKISFEVEEYSTGLELSGFYHIGKGCKIWNNISELYDLISEAKAKRVKQAKRVGKEILFQSFKEVL